MKVYFDTSELYPVVQIYKYDKDDEWFSEEDAISVPTGFLERFQDNRAEWNKLQAELSDILGAKL